MQTGSPAPDFTLLDQHGNEISLHDFKGKTVVLYFYPKDNTPGCTRQACAFAEHYGEYQKRGVTVIGISKDSVASHQKFTQKFHLPFILLADPGLAVLQAYHVWQEKNSYGKTVMGVVRTTFVINPDGIITHILPKVNPDTNAEEVLELL